MLSAARATRVLHNMVGDAGGDRTPPSRPGNTTRITLGDARSINRGANFKRVAPPHPRVRPLSARRPGEPREFPVEQGCAGPSGRGGVDMTGSKQPTEARKPPWATA